MCEGVPLFIGKKQRFSFTEKLKKITYYLQNKDYLICDNKISISSFSSQTPHLIESYSFLLQLH